jgi:hypothetical protein
MIKKYYFFINSLVLIFFVCLMYLPANIKAQTLEQKEKSIAILKTNLLAPINLTYENSLNSKRSLLIDVRYSPKANIAEKGNRFILTSELRFYTDTSKDRLSGFYVGPYLRFKHITIAQQPDVAAAMALKFLIGVPAGFEKPERKVNSLGVGGVAGYQWIFRKNFTIDIFAGAGYNPIVGKKEVPSWTGSRNYRINMRCGFSIGYAFISPT